MLWYKILWLKSFEQLKLKNYIRNKTVFSIKTMIVYAMSKTIGTKQRWLWDGIFWGSPIPDPHPGDWGWGFFISG